MKFLKITISCSFLFAGIFTVSCTQERTETPELLNLLTLLIPDEKAESMQWSTVIENTNNIILFESQFPKKGLAEHYYLSGTSKLSLQPKSKEAFDIDISLGGKNPHTYNEVYLSYEDITDGNNPIEQFIDYCLDKNTNGVQLIFNEEEREGHFAVGKLQIRGKIPVNIRYCPGCFNGKAMPSVIILDITF